MKIFNKESSSEVAYIQLEDIMFLATLKSDDEQVEDYVNQLLQKSISPDSDTTAIDYINKRHFVRVMATHLGDFVKVEETYLLEFIKNLDFCVDYRMYRNLSYEELDSIIYNLKKYLDELEDKYKNTTNGNEQQIIEEDYMIKHHKMKDIESILEFKKGITKLNLPIELDYESFALIGRNGLELRATLNPNVLLLKHISGANIEASDTVEALAFIKEGLAILMNQRKSNCFFTSSDTNISYAPDMSYMRVDIMGQTFMKEEDRPLSSKFSRQRLFFIK